MIGTTRVTAAAMAATCLMFTGCVRLQVNPLSGAGPERGLVYALPFTQYEVTVTRRLHACGDKPDIRNHVTAANRQLPDPAHSYAIDHDSLSNAFKTSSLGVRNYPNGTLRQITAEADDRTGQVILNVATAAIDIAVAVVRAGAGGGAVQGAASACTPAAIAALQSVRTTEANLRAATVALQNATARWEAIRDASALLGTRPDGATQASVLRTVLALSAARVAQDVAKAANVRALVAVTETHTFVWPPDGRTFSAGNAPALSAETLSRWLVQGTSFSPLSLAVQLEIRDAVTGQPPTVGGDASPGTPEDGIRYRMPGRGRLVAREPTTGNETEFDEGAVPQLGRLMLLPFTNRLFQQNILEATFNENGSLESARYGEPASTAERASAVAAQLAARASPTIDALAAAQNAGLARETARDQARLSRLQAAQNLRTGQAALIPNPNGADETTRRLLGADTTLREAQRANVEARIALDAAVARARAGGVELP